MKNYPWFLGLFVKTCSKEVSESLQSFKEIAGHDKTKFEMHFLPMVAQEQKRWNGHGPVKLEVLLTRFGRGWSSDYAGDALPREINKVIAGLITGSSQRLLSYANARHLPVDYNVPVDPNALKEKEKRETAKDAKRRIAQWEDHILGEFDKKFGKNALDSVEGGEEMKRKVKRMCEKMVNDPGEKKRKRNSGAAESSRKMPQRPKRATFNRGHSRIICNWYLTQPPENVIIECSKCGLASGRNTGFSHHDLIRLCCVTTKACQDETEKSVREFTLKYLLSQGKGWWSRDQPINEKHWGTAEVEKLKQTEAMQEILRIVSVIDKVKHFTSDTDVEEVRGLIETNEWLTKQHINSALVKRPEVISALLSRVTLRELLRWVPSLWVDNEAEGSRNSAEVNKAKIMDRLTDLEQLKGDTVLPDEILVCLTHYEEGKGKVRKANLANKRQKCPVSFRPDTELVSAMHNLYLESFKHCKPSGKRMLICTEVTEDVLSKEIYRVKPLTGSHIVSSLMIRAARTERDPLLMAFSTGTCEVVPLHGITGQSGVQEVRDKLKETPECKSVPLLEKVFHWVAKEKQNVDVFVLVLKMKAAAKKCLPAVLEKCRAKCNNKKAKVIFVLLQQPEDVEPPQGIPDCLTFTGFDRFTSELVWMAARGEL